MEIVYDDETLSGYVTRATVASPEHPVLVDRFLDDAIEIDVDALYDGTDMYLGGIMEHIEEAGIHSGDSACTLPPVTLGDEELERVRRATLQLAEGIGVRGLMNVQFALAQDVLYVLEANPRASRTVPFVAKATGRPHLEGGCPGHARLDHQRAPRGGAAAPHRRRRAHAEPCAGRGQGGRAAVQALPDQARARSSTACSGRRCARPARSWASTRTSARPSPRASSPPTAGCPRKGCIFVSVANRDKRAMIFPVKRLADLGFTLIATTGTAEVLRRNGITAEVVRKVSQRGTAVAAHDEPSIVDLILGGEIAMVVNTPIGPNARADGYAIRAATTSMDKPIITTVQELAAAVQGIEAQMHGELRVKSLQEHARDLDLYGQGARA